MTSPAVLLVRHGETEWSVSGKHTGRTDLPLTAKGRDEARLLAAPLASLEFALVLTSPLARARETCELAGLGGRADVDRDLMEWDYGDYEGRTTAEIRAGRPGWELFDHGCPGGESPDAVAARVDRVIARVRAAPGDVIVFAHGHISRSFAVRWIGLPVAAGAHFLLDTATTSVLAGHRGVPVIRRWNAPVARLAIPQTAAGPTAGPTRGPAAT